MNILGVRVDNVDFDGALRKIESFLADGRQHYIVTPNPEIVVLAQKDEEFKEILNKADLSIPDGAGIIFASKFLKGDIKEKVSGVDLMEKLLKNQKSRPEGARLAQQSWAANLKNQNNPSSRMPLIHYGAGISKIKNNRIFLFGGRNGAAKRISEKFSNIAGFTENDSEAIKLINESMPDILFVALGAPKQEKWIHYNIAKIPSVKVAIGVGGAFDFISGRIRRAPKFLRKIGLEWLWRFILQPWRVKRIFNATIKFPWLIFRSRSRADH